ncbi:hypothetical protein ACDA63_05970 [Uliginosibacterium sp. sgz301328]|uniref:hypothetical protein n=1 Tax=Uliginosibacterium sp. sgz301328 TaxID=3243764 RepID=UPI00359E4979
MNKTSLAASAMLCLALAACDDNGNDSDASNAQSSSAPSVSVADLSPGTYAVVMGEESAPVLGQYYSAADGSRTLIVDDANALATAIYRRTTDGKWSRTPAASSDTSVSFLRSSAVANKTMELAALAGSYVASVDGKAAAFALTADGRIAAIGTGACRIGGTIGTEVVQGARKLSLSTSGCALPASLDGLIIGDADYAPAVLRLVLDDGSKLSELWAYAE